jgi:hypothetical protein
MATNPYEVLMDEVSSPSTGEEVPMADVAAHKARQPSSRASLHSQPLMPRPNMHMPAPEPSTPIIPPPWTALQVVKVPLTAGGMPEGAPGTPEAVALGVEGRVAAMADAAKQAAAALPQAEVGSGQWEEPRHRKGRPVYIESPEERPPAPPTSPEVSAHATKAVTERGKHAVGAATEAGMETAEAMAAHAKHAVGAATEAGMQTAERAARVGIETVGAAVAAGMGAAEKVPRAARRTVAAAEEANVELLKVRGEAVLSDSSWSPARKFRMNS